MAFLPTTPTGPGAGRRGALGPIALRALLGILGAGGPTLAADRVVVSSPLDRVRLTVAVEAGRLVHNVDLDGRPVIRTSTLGILVDGVDLGLGARIGAVERHRTDETYPWRGVHSLARDRSNGARIAVRHGRTGTAFTVDVRVFDDAAAFRHVVTGKGRRVPDAASAFRLPPGSVVWYHGHRDHYEGLHSRRAIEEVGTDEWAVPPLTFRLPDGRGYAAITEAALTDYAGMVLQADGRGGFLERLGHAAPPSYPFTLRYGEAEAKRLSVPAATEGPITTPWRVVLAGRDLDTLVSSDAIPSLCPPPDPRLFPQGLRTPWLRPGRAVWRYLDGGERTFEGAMEFSRLAGELGFEHHVVEGQWREWSEAQLRELVESSRARGVSIWLWIHSRDQRDAEKRRQLFGRLHELGVAGIKVDFFDHEARETIDLYHDILRDAAASQLLANFHGANKPTGEPRTWPNEMTREGIRGLEYRRTEAWAAHNTTLPFTRFLAGHADYTPVVFSERRKETTATHQIATAIVFTSPVMVYGGHPKGLLESPAAEVIRSIPSVWDQTVVLPGSAISELAAFARRSGERWFLGVLNGPDPRRLSVELTFLGGGPFKAVLVRDVEEGGTAVALEERDVTGNDRLDLDLRAASGFVARFSPVPR